mmetsp:Transcript_2344/g.2667  ORF Transcript_2344/g.2667 Transcript_2344/m.2667 type:complete len:109 (+) Transcript_2344:237-563(+)
MDVETQKLLMTAQGLRQEASGLATKITELEAEANEHQLVIDTLKDVDPERKCYRLIGDALVEQTVKDVLPSVASNKEQIRGVIGRFSEELKKKEDEADKIFKDVEKSQ